MLLPIILPFPVVPPPRQQKPWDPHPQHLPAPCLSLPSGTQNSFSCSAPSKTSSPFSCCRSSPHCPPPPPSSPPLSTDFIFFLPFFFFFTTNCTYKLLTPTSLCWLTCLGKANRLRNAGLDPDTHMQAHSDRREKKMTVLRLCIVLRQESLCPLSRKSLGDVRNWEALPDSSQSLRL